jgi:hypothetical protein
MQAQAQRKWFVFLPDKRIWVEARWHQIAAAIARKRDGDSEGDERVVTTPYQLKDESLDKETFQVKFKKVVNIPGTNVFVTSYIAHNRDDGPNDFNGNTTRMALGTSPEEIKAALATTPDIWQLVGGMRRRRKSKSKSRKMSKRRRGRKIHKTKRANIKRRKSYRNRK